MGCDECESGFEAAWKPRPISSPAETTGKLRGRRIRIKVDLRVELNLGLLRRQAAYVLISLGAVVALAHVGTPHPRLG